MDRKKILIPLYEEKSLDERSNIELAEIKICGKDIISHQCSIFLKMSKEALIGFATYAIRVASTTKVTDKIHWQVDPLGNPCGNQPLGFFLTNDSPSFVLIHNQVEKMKLKSEFRYKEFNDKCKFRFNYEVPLEVLDNAYETFEIGFENVAAIMVVDKNGIDVTDKCMSIVLEINTSGLFKFGISLLRIAHNYETGDQYLVGHVNGSEEMYNFGVVLTEMSSILRIQCGSCGSVFKYEPYFGV